jgi:hypothetical protein
MSTKGFPWWKIYNPYGERYDNSDWVIGLYGWGVEEEAKVKETIKKIDAEIAKLETNEQKT